MSITAAEFKIRFPEFATTDNARIDLFIADSVIILNETYWGTKYDLGLYYSVAHFLAIADKTEAGSSGSIGAVASKTVDGTSIAYVANAPAGVNDAYYSSTSYGQRYLALRKTLGVPASVI